MESNTTAGASNAADFQPPTQNPQGTTPDLQRTPQGLQPSAAGSQEQLNIQVPLKVETVQSGTATSPSAAVPASSDGSAAGVLLFIAAVLIAALLYKKWNLFTGLAQPVQAAAKPEATPAKRAKPEKPAVKPKTNNKPKAKKKPRSKR